MTTDITQEEIKSMIRYDPETGVFSWVKHRMKRKGFGCLHRGYLTVHIGARMIFAHRLAFLYMTGSMPEEGVDHIDGDTTNNRWANLRPASKAENGRNMKVGSRNKSGVMGVGWRSDNLKWRAFIKVDKRQIDLGSYDDFFLAVCARKAAEVTHGFHPNHGRAA